MELTWTLLAIIASLVIYGYYSMMNIMTFWERKRVAHLKPLPFVGNILNVILFKNSMGEIYKEAYTKYPNEKIVGLYELLKPVMIVRDPKIIEKILIKDYQYFVDHPSLGDETGLFANGLFQLRGVKWRSMRIKISPAFTSGKLKSMFSDMIDCSNDLVDVINKNLNKDYEIRPDVSNFTLDVIASTVFGIQIKDQKAKEEFTRMGNSTFAVTPLKFIEIFIAMELPRLAKLFGLTIMDRKAISYFKGLILNTLEQRVKGKVQRNDYVQQLLKLKEKGSIEIQANEEEDEYLDLTGSKPSTENFEITDDLLIGQAFQFLSAGFDPLYMTMILVMFDLATRTHIQERARQQIKEVLEKHGGYSYEAVKDMTYLEQCIQETLRVHTLVGFLMRECTKTYVTEDGLEIEKGMKVIIPLNALHTDPKYFPDPEVYNPERLPPNSTRNNFIYMPFGDGPRMCIGLRFALVEVKLGLAKILDNFNFTLSPKTKVPFDINKQSIILFPKSKIMFNLTKV